VPLAQFDFDVFFALSTPAGLAMKIAGTGRRSDADEEGDEE